MKKLENFKAHTGTVCMSSVIRDFSNYILNTNYTEELLYGLGSGLFFGYTVTDEIVGVGGSTDYIVDNIKDCLTLTKVETVVHDDKIFEFIRFCIDNYTPVMVSGYHFISDDELKDDILIKEKLNLPMNYHYSIISGYDDEKRQLYISDNTKVAWVSYEKFLKSREPRHIMLQFLYPEKIENLDLRIYSSIRKVTDYWYRMPERPKQIADMYTKNFLHISKIYNTMEGLKAFRNSFLEGPEIENLDKFKASMMFMQMYTYRGTGGDMTRGMYSRFLKESADICKDNELLELSKLYANAAREWRIFFKSLADDPEILYEKIMDSSEKKIYKVAIERIYDCEMKAITSLKDLIDRR